MREKRSAGFGVWWEAARPRTLPAAIAPVLVATALAWRGGSFQGAAAFTCLAFALLIQIGTNYANDYFDFIKGADTAARVGPRRAVAAGLIAPETMRRAMVMVFAVAFLVGLTLLRFGGWPLLVVGVTSIVCGVAYTGGPFPLAYHGWGDVFVFVFFGLVAVGATYFVQAGRLTTEAWLLGSAMGALATNILVVNNYRDVETDRVAGKRTLAVRLGRGFARGQFAAAHLWTIGVVGGLWWRGVIGPIGAVGVMAFAAWQGFQQGRKLARTTEPKELIRLLGETGRYVGLMALLLSGALIVSR